jgi:glycosyltransferase involved in cell wall biosynthesis
MQESFVLVGSLPPPYTGQAVAFEMLVQAVRERGWPHRTINLSRGLGEELTTFPRARHRVRDFSLLLAEYGRAAAFGQKTVYLTIAQSRRGFLRDLPVIWLAALFRHRIVLHLHGGNYGNFYREQPTWYRALIRATLRRADLVLVLGERLRSMFDFEPELSLRLRVVPNGLPFACRPVEEPKRLPKSPAEPVNVLYLSNLVESKGYLDLLAAASILVKERGMRHLRFHFCGSFMENPADDRRVRSAEHARTLFDDFVREHGLEEQVAYRGTVVGEEKDRMLREAHFFVLPTYYNNEGQPVSIIEAMAHGAVVISTDYRAIPDVVRDGVTGRLVPYEQPAAIADAITSLVEVPEKFERMSAAAIARYRAGFTGEEHIRRLLPLLAPSMAKRPAVVLPGPNA